MALHVHEWGEPTGPPVVCLHGVRSHGRVFRRLAEERLARRFRVLALDLRGHGRSDWEPPWDFATHVRDVLETLERLAVERAAFVGHSFGGRLVMELLLEAPAVVDRAVLLDPAIWIPPPIALDRAELSRPDRSYATVEEAIEQRYEESVLHSTPHEFLEEEAELHLVRHEDGRFRYRYSQSAVVAAFGEMAKTPPPAEWLRVPTLIVRGEQSEIVPEQLVDWYRDGIGELLEVATVRGGHVVLWDAFDETADAVEAFLV